MWARSTISPNTQVTTRRWSTRLRSLGHVQEHWWRCVETTSTCWAVTLSTTMSSLPLHWTEDGLAMGVQLIARHGREDLLIQVASQLENALPWSDRHPSVNAIA